MRISRTCVVYVVFVSIIVTSQGGDGVYAPDSNCVCGSCVCGECRPHIELYTKPNYSDIQEISTQVRGMKTQLRLLLLRIPQDEGVLPKDCSEVLSSGITDSGVYKVQPLDLGRPLRVYCDMDTNGGGWTVFQRRQDGSVDFYQSFASYRRGFGESDGEFWLGNDNLHRLTAQDEYELRIDMADADRSSRYMYAVYDLFAVGHVNNNYSLTIGEYTGTAGDSMSYHNNMPFTTKDRDNDNSASNCAKTFHGGWWFDSCQQCNLNGDYFGEGGDLGMVWIGVALKTSEMKFRMKV